MSNFSQKRELEYQKLTLRKERRVADEIALAGAAGGVGLLILGVEIGSIALPVVAVGIGAAAAAVKLCSSFRRHGDNFVSTTVDRRTGRDRRQATA